MSSSCPDAQYPEATCECCCCMAASEARAAIREEYNEAYQYYCYCVGVEIVGLERNWGNICKPSEYKRITRGEQG